jgi:hypothetical protein
MLIHGCRDMFATPLPNNERGAEHRKRRTSIVAGGNVFAKPLSSNELFRLSGVVSQYKVTQIARSVVT